MGHILKLTNKDPRFYTVMGPFLSRREITKELGFPVWDEDGKTWYVSVDDNGGVLGFAATRPGKRGTVFCSAYVLPQHRKQGIYRSLIAARMVDNPGVILTTATAASKLTLERCGFAVVRQHGAYTDMKVEAE